MVLHWYYILLFSLILVLHQEPKRPENPKNPQGFTNYKTTTVAVVILLQIVNPQQLSCFVLDERNGRLYYYPVRGLAKTQRVMAVYGDTPGAYSFQDINIDPYTDCQNPMEVKSPITAVDLLRFEEKVGAIDYYEWFCPQLVK